MNILKRLFGQNRNGSADKEKKDGEEKGAELMNCCRNEEVLKGQDERVEVMRKVFCRAKEAREKMKAYQQKFKAENG